MDAKTVTTQKTKSPILILFILSIFWVVWNSSPLCGKFGTAFLMLITLGGLEFGI